jgi:phage recombination protein Bet
MNEPKTTAVAALAQVSVPAFAMPEAELLAALESTCYPGAALPSVKLVVNVCRAQHLDPFQKPYHIVPMNVKKAKSNDYEWRDVVMPGVGLYRTQAARTGAFAGVDEGVFGEKVTGAWGPKGVAYPEWCSVTVYRIVQGERVAFSSGKVYWLESYATKSRESDTPNAMWSKRPFGQLEKCAEALALRRAFPEVGAAPTADEMAGKVIDNETGEIISNVQTEAPPPAKTADKLKDRIKKGTPPIDVGQPKAPPSQANPNEGFTVGEIVGMFQKAQTKEALAEACDAARALKREEEQSLANTAYKQAKDRVMSGLGPVTETLESGGAATATAP